MSELDGWLLEEYERYLEQTGVAPATVRGKLSSLDQLLQYCASIEVVDDDLPDKLEVPTLSKSEQTSDKKLDADDARPLLEFFRESMRHKGTAQHVVLELMWHVGGGSVASALSISATGIPIAACSGSGIVHQLV